MYGGRGKLNLQGTTGNEFLDNSKRFLNKRMLEVILVLLILIMSLTTVGFLTIGNLLNILRNVSLQ